MLIYLYNFIQFLIIILFGPIILLFICLKKKYRDTAKFRFAYDLSTIPPKKEGQPTYYFHALSVGETLSIMPLIKTIKAQNKKSRIILTTGTSSGYQLAKNKLSSHIDGLAVAPMDIYPIVKRFYDHIEPDIYIHTETDFWLNRLNYLKNKNIPTVLINGQISEKSFARYRRFHFYFQELFNCFDLLCMQTENAKSQMIKLGLDKDKVKFIGNLKFSQNIETTNLPAVFKPLEQENFTIVAGSTHPKEEAILLQSFSELRTTFPESQLIIVPRDISRSIAIQKEAQSLGFSSSLRSAEVPTKDVLIVDTIGELLSFYKLANLCFVGGSLLDFGGHNPIEPAQFAKPILFGPFMADFPEISASLLAQKGAIKVDNLNLTDTIIEIFSDNKLSQDLSTAAKTFSLQNQNVIDNHLKEINSLISEVI